MNAEEFIEGVYIRFRALDGEAAEENTGDNSTGGYRLLSVRNDPSSSYTVANLSKNTRYELFLVPYYKCLEGSPSNTVIVRTLDDGKLKLKIILCLQGSGSRINTSGEFFDRLKNLVSKLCEY